jgi:hypothetical protein
LTSAATVGASTINWVAAATATGSALVASVRIARTRTGAGFVFFASPRAFGNNHHVIAVCALTAITSQTCALWLGAPPPPHPDGGVGVVHFDTHIASTQVHTGVGIIFTATLCVTAIARIGRPCLTSHAHTENDTDDKNRKKGHTSHFVSSLPKIYSKFGTENSDLNQKIEENKTNPSDFIRFINGFFLIFPHEFRL